MGDSALKRKREYMFTTVVKGLRDVYPTDALKDISTSYCFICFLHLANENSLSIDNRDGLEELAIGQH